MTASQFETDTHNAGASQMSIFTRQGSTVYKTENGKTEEVVSYPNTRRGVAQAVSSLRYERKKEMERKNLK